MAKKTVDKWKAKKSFELVAPPIFNEKKLGKTFASEPEEVKGRTITLDYSDVVGKKKKRDKVKLHFEAEEVKGGKVPTKFLGHSIVPDYERSLTRKGTSKIYVNEKVTTKDKKDLNMKAIAITASQIKKSMQEKVRKGLREQVRKKASGKTLENLISDILSNKVGRSIKNNLSEVYPLKYVVIQKTEVNQ